MPPATTPPSERSGCPGQQGTPAKQGKQPSTPCQGGPRGLCQLGPQRKPETAGMLTPLSPDWGGQVLNFLAGPWKKQPICGSRTSLQKESHWLLAKLLKISWLFRKSVFSHYCAQSFREPPQGGTKRMGLGVMRMGLWSSLRYEQAQ